METFFVQIGILIINHHDSACDLGLGWGLGLELGLVLGLALGIGLEGIATGIG